nr:leucine-rich repeat protein [Eubacterium sp.]
MQKITVCWKRFWAWCLVMTVLCGTTERIPVVVHASTVASGTCGENQWKLDSDGVLHISGSGSFARFSEDEVPWKSLRGEIKKVSFGMTSVTGGDLSYYFSKCTSLKSVNAIPSGVQGLNGTFEGCTALLSVGAIPDSVQSMCETFKGCARLDCSVRIPENVSAAKGAFDGCTSLSKTPTVLSNVIFDMEYMFRGTAIVTPPVIPGSAKNMTGCFYECAKLTAAPEIPESVTNLAYCFYGCESMKNAPVLPTKVEDIRYAFWHCTSMTNAPDIPLYVKYMQNCMVGCISVSGTMTIYAVITEEENYNQFAGETKVYNVDSNPKFLGGGGTGLSVSYTNLNQEYIRAYLATGWNSGALLYYEDNCGKLSLGTMLEADVDDCEVESIPAYTYTGKAKRPTPNVYYGNRLLTVGEDYAYMYQNNTNAGTATLTIVGEGMFSGSKVIPFTITPLKFSSVKVVGYSGTYDGNPHSISLVCDDGAKVEYGTVAGKYTSETCPGYTLPGTYTTYYRITKSNYETVTGSAKVVIKAATLTVESSGFQGEFDGNPHSIQVKSETGTTIRYGTKAGEYTMTVCPTYVNAGTYTVYYEVSKTGYRTQTGKQTVEISRKVMKNIEFPTASSIGYGERLATASFHGGDMEYGAFSWETPDVIPEVINDGYVVVFKANDSNNYDYRQVPGYEEGVIKRKIPLMVEPIKGNTPTFSVSMLADGDVLGISQISTDATVKGSLVWENPLQIVTSNVAKYSIRFTPEDCENYDWSGVPGYDSEEGYATLKAQVLVVQYPMAETIAYGESLAQSMMKSNETGVEYSWKESDYIPQESGYYEAIFRAGDEEIVRSVWVNVAKAIPQCETPILETTIYDPRRSLQEIELPAGWQWMEPEQVPCVESHTYEAIFTPEDTKHYECVKRAIPLCVTKAEPVVEVPYIVGISYEEGQMLKEIPLPVGWQWKAKSQKTRAGVQSYEAMFVPVDTSNYKTIVRWIRMDLGGISEVTATPKPTRMPEVTLAPSVSPKPTVMPLPSVSPKPTVMPLPSVSPEPLESQIPEANVETSLQEIGQENSLMIYQGDVEESGFSVSQEDAETIQQSENYDKKIAQWIREIDKNNKKNTRVKIRKIRRNGKRIKIKWKKMKEAKGYQIVCTPNKKVSAKTKKRFSKKCTITLSVKKKRKHYVRVRSVFKQNGKRTYGAWSKRKAI